MTPEMFLTTGSVVATLASVIAVVAKIVMDKKVKDPGRDTYKYWANTSNLRAKRGEVLFHKSGPGFESREYAALVSDVVKDNIGDFVVKMSDGSRIVFQGKFFTEETVRKAVQAIER